MYEGINRKQPNLNFRKVLISIVVCLGMIFQGFAVPVNADPITKIMEIDFPSSLSRTASKTVNIPNLKSVVNITTSTGTVSHTILGENVTVNVSGGSATGSQPNPTKYSRTESTTQTSMSNNLPSTVSYNSGGYSGTLYGQGVTTATVQTGGSYTPADSKTATDSVTIWQDTVLRYSEPSGWTIMNVYNSGYPNSLSYNAGGYSGTLNYTHKTPYSGPNDLPATGTPGQIHYLARWYGTAYYSGSVTRPASDTRTYGTQYSQNYSGTVYAPGYDDLYSYTVILEYIDNKGPLLTTTVPEENRYFSKLNFEKALSCIPVL